MTDPLLVPVADTVTLRQTVGYAVERALETEATGTGQTADDAPEDDAPPVANIHFVDVMSFRATDVDADQRLAEAEELLDRVEVWAREDAGDRADELAIETAAVGAEERLFAPADYARVLSEYARDHAIDRVLFDPEYVSSIGVPLLQPLEVELARLGDFTIEEAPVEHRTRRGRLIGAGGLPRLATVFGLSYLFYLALGGFSGTFDLVTGAVAATLVTVALARISFVLPPNAVRTPLRAIRLGLYVPYLFWEILKANLVVSYAILHPKLPIEPRMTRMRVEVFGEAPLTTLANSITLTPGTLTVRSRGRDLYVHTLVPSAREDLFDGGLERAVRFVFYGRDGLRMESPRDRSDTEILGGEDQ